MYAIQITGGHSMTDQTKKRIHLIYGIVLIAVTIIAGLCLMYGCYNIYTTGVASDASQIYSRQIVQETFAGIAIPVYLCLALVIGSFILYVALPVEKKKLVPEKNYAMILQRLRAKKAFSPDQTDLHNAVLRLQKLRRIHAIISLALILVCAIVFLIPACRSSYWPNPSDPNETRDVTDAMIGMMPLFAICVLIPMGYTLFTAYFFRRSIRKEIELMKQAAATATEAPKSCHFHLSQRTMTIIRCAIVVAGIVFIFVGVSNGGVEAIIAKAVAICTECIGLG